MLGIVTIQTRLQVFVVAVHLVLFGTKTIAEASRFVPAVTRSPEHTMYFLLHIVVQGVCIVLLGLRISRIISRAEAQVTSWSKDEGLYTEKQRNQVSW